MRTTMSSKEIPHRTYDVHEGVRRKAHVMICGRDGCDNKEVWNDASGTWIVPQKVLAHFRNRGWGIGKDRTHDICPDCLAAERVAKPLKTRPVVSPMLLPPPANNVTAEAALEAVLGPMAEALAEHPMAPEPEPIPPLDELLAEIDAPAEPTPHVGPNQGRTRINGVHAHTPALPRAPPRLPGRRAVDVMTRGFASSWGADQAARSYLERVGVRTAQRDRDYRMYLLPDGFAWDRLTTTPLPLPPEATVWPPRDGGDRRAGRVIKAHTPVFPLATPTGRRSPGIMTRGFVNPTSARNAARRFLRDRGIAEPKPGLDYRTLKFEDGWGWDATTTTTTITEEKTMSLNDRIVTRAVTMSDAAPMPANDDTGPRASTLAQRREIRDYLDANYDDDNGRWRGDLSDRKVAELLGMPRAWITQVRDSVFGPDINEVQAKEREVDAQTLKQLADLEGIIGEVQKEIGLLRSKLEGRKL